MMEQLQDRNDQPDLSSKAESIARNKLLLLIVGAIFIAATMVYISMRLYDISGTAQIDLSRPDYQAVRNKISNQSTDMSFSSDGPINEKVLEEYRKTYEEQMKQAIDSQSFSGEPLSDEALRIGDLERAEELIVTE